MYVCSITDDKTKPPEDNLRITFSRVSKEQTLPHELNFGFKPFYKD